MLTYIKYVEKSVFFPHLDSSQHSCGGNTEIQVSQHLCCGGFIDVRGPLPGKIIWKKQDTKNCLEFL